MYIFKLLFLIFNGYKSHNIFFSTCVPKPLPPSISDLKFRVQIKRSLSFKILKSKFHQIQRKKSNWINKYQMTQYLEEISYHIFIVSLRPLFEKKGGETMKWIRGSCPISFHFHVLFCFAFFVNRLKCAFFVWQ